MEETRRLSGASKLVLGLIAATTLTGFTLMARVQDTYHRLERLSPKHAAEIRQEYLEDRGTAYSGYAALLPTVFSLYLVGATEAVRRKETS